MKDHTITVRRVIISRKKEWQPLAVIDCPYCNKNHYHGASDGHRVGHCDGGDYYLVGTNSAPRVYKSKA